MRYRKTKAKHIGEVLEEVFAPENMGTGQKRGMVLKIYKAKIKEALAGNTNFAAHITGEKLVGRDDHPTLVVWLKPGSHWRNELHMQREYIKQLINERLQDEFLEEVKFK